MAEKNLDRAEEGLSGDFPPLLRREVLSAHTSKNDEQIIVGGSFASLLRVSRIFGVAPLRFQHKNDGYLVSISIPMCIYSYLIVTAMSVVTILGIIKEGSKLYSVDPKSFYLSRIVLRCNACFMILTACVGVYGAPHRMRSMFKFLRIITSVDRAIGTRYSCGKELRLRIGLACVWFLIITLIITDTYFFVSQAMMTADREFAVLVHFEVHYFFFLRLLMVLQFFFIAMSVYARFKALNNVLDVTSSYLSLQRTELAKIPDTFNIIAVRIVHANIPFGTQRLMRKSLNGEPRLVVSFTEAISRIASLQGILCDIVYQINNSYGILIVCILMMLLLDFTTYPLYTYFDIEDAITKQRFLLTFLRCLMWAILYLLDLFMLVEPCHYTYIESNRTNSLVCRMIMMSPTAGTLASCLKAFSHQLMLRSVSYKPMGFFTLGRALVTTMFGAVSTYLVILLQF